MFYNLTSIESVGTLFNILEKCRGVEQNAEHHPEGDVFVHSVQVLYHALRETNDIDLIFAAMLHDVGKQVQNNGHDEIAIQMLDGKISEKTAWLIENHMRFWTFVLGDMKRLSKVQYLRNHEWFPDLVMLCRWDKLGRNPNKKCTYDRISIVDKLIRIYAYV